MQRTRYECFYSGPNKENDRSNVNNSDNSVDAKSDISSSSI